MRHAWWAVLLAMPMSAMAAEAEKTAEVIRTEALRPNGDATGRPLPLAGHWNTGHYPRNPGFDANWQMEQVAQGRLLLPWFQLNPPQWDQIPAAQYEAAIKRAAALKLPISFISTQWESMLTTEKRYFDLPAAQNPNVVAANGAVQKRVSPFGPVEPWREAGKSWTTQAVVKQLQEWYPDPPLVVFVSNNEHAKLTWNQVEQDQRYLAKHGKGKDDDFKRRVTAEGWIERYRALQDGMRDGLTAPAWKKNAIFVGYEAFGPAHFGRWGGWKEYSLVTPGRIDPWPLAFDGGSPSFYVHNWNPSTDYTVWGPQVESMNWPFMLDDAWRLNRKFWWEFSLWDGYEPSQANDMRKTYAKAGQTYGPERYRGMVQFGMWLLRPRVVREFRGWTDGRDTMWPYFKEVCDAIARVHTDPTLTEFWRKGTLVPNRARKHPYQETIPAEFANVDRWFLLDTDLMPKEPWKLTTEIPVFAVALSLGEAPNRRWLVYAHAPLGEKAVQITLPEFGPVKATVGVGGTYLVVSEKDKSVRELLSRKP